MDDITPILQQKFIQQAHNEGISRFVVGGLICRWDTNQLEILVLERIGSDFMGGIEELPSGKVESGEGLFDALKREIKEETGIKVNRILAHIFDFDYLSSGGRLTRQFNFATQSKVTEVCVDSQEHMGYRWLSLDEIEDSKLTDNIKQALTDNWESLVRIYRDKDSIANSD